MPLEFPRESERPRERTTAMSGPRMEKKAGPAVGWAGDPDLEMAECL